MSALHVCQGPHLRCLAGNPAPSDPPMSRVILAAQFIDAEFIICNPAFSEAELAVARTFAPNAKLYASFDATFWPKDHGIGNAFYDQFREATKGLVWPGSELYRLEYGVASTLVLIAENMTLHYDGIYWDDFFATLPGWIVTQWEALGVTATKSRKWPAYRDALLAAITLPGMANVGPVTSSGAQKYRSKGLVVSVEAEHGTPAEIVRALAPAPVSVVWPSRTEPLPEVYTMLPGMICPGTFLPPA